MFGKVKVEVDGDFSSQRDGSVDMILVFQIDHFDGLCCARLRSVIWTLFEDPNSSSAARVGTWTISLNTSSLFDQVLVIVSSLFLLSSIIMLILSTIPTFQVNNICISTIFLARTRFHWTRGFHFAFVQIWDARICQSCHAPTSSKIKN